MTRPPGRTEPIPDVTYYLQPVRRRWRFVIAGVAVGLALAAGADVLIHRDYTSTAAVLVTDTGATTASNSVNGRTQTDINLDTEAQLVKSHAVGRRVEQALGLTESIGRLVRPVSVTVPPNSTVLRISYTARTRTQARARAQAFANAYLADRSATAHDYLVQQAALIRARMTTIGQELRAVPATANAAQGGAHASAAIRARVNSYASQLSVLQSRLTKVTSTVVTPGEVIADAQLATAAGPSSALILLSGAMAGLLLGLAAAFVRERTDPRIRYTATLADLGIPVLATVPEDSEGALRAYQRVCNVVFAECGTDDAVVMVAAVSREQTDGDGAASGLASALTDFGRSVSTLRLPGASSIPATATAQQAALVPQGGNRIDLTLEQSKQATDFVVIQAAPLSVEPLGQTLAGSCDGVILIVELGASRTDDLVDAVRQVQVMHGRVLGAIATHG